MTDDRLLFETLAGVTTATITTILLKKGCAMFGCAARSPCVRVSRGGSAAPSPCASCPPAKTSPPPNAANKARYEEAKLKG